MRQHENYSGSFGSTVSSIFKSSYVAFWTSCGRIFLTRYNVVGLSSSLELKSCNYLILSYLILSYLILSYLILSHLISSHLISSHIVSSRLVSSRLFSSHLISSHFLSSHLTSSHLTSIVWNFRQKTNQMLVKIFFYKLSSDNLRHNHSDEVTTFTNLTFSLFFLFLLFLVAIVFYEQILL